LEATKEMRSCKQTFLSSFYQPGKDAI